MFLHQADVDAMGGVALLGRTCLVLLKPPAYQLYEGAQHWPRTGLLHGVPRWACIPKSLTHRAPVVMAFPGDSTDALSVYIVGPTDSL